MAVLPMPGYVLGLEMMPYSLGCELQLFREDSPWLTMSMDEFNAMSFEKQLTALIRGLNICCRKMPRWRRLWWWMYRPRTPAQLALPIAEFRNYLWDGRLQFRYELCTSGGDGESPVRYLGEPELLRLYRFVCASVPRGEVELYGRSAWDFPYSFAKMLYQGDMEEKGGIEIYNVRGQTHDAYHQQSEDGRAAWGGCATDDERRAALEKHPIIRDLAGLEEEVAAFENSVKTKEDIRRV